MANKEMWDYFTGTVTADYTTAIDWASFLSQNVLPFVRVTPKNTHEMGDGSILTVTKGTLYFLITPQWNVITLSNHGILLDLYNLATQGNETARSFYYDHPADGHSYTAYFHGELKSSYDAKMPNFMKIDPVELRVVGRKPA